MRTRTSNILTFAAALLAASGGQAFAAERTGTPLLVNPAANSRPGAAAAGSITRGGEGLKVRIINSCFGTNLRGVKNPLSPNSNVEAQLEISYNVSGSSSPRKLLLNVTYPAEIVTKDGIVAEPDSPVSASAFSGSIDGTDISTKLKAGFYGNIVRIDVPGEDITLHATGDVAGQHYGAATLTSSSFAQKAIDCSGGAVYGSAGWSAKNPAYPCGSYMGTNGPLSAGKPSVTTSSDNKAIDIAIAFPGQTGFCGSFWSPLMLFVDGKRPNFSGASTFKLSDIGRTFWVEPGAPGYFLAMDRDGNGMIEGKSELFGDQDTGKNGFDALAELDSNGDGMISSKDKRWNDLLLWQDANGDGVSQAGELKPAKELVTKVSLKYKNVNQSYGETAQARQVGEFWFKKNGKERKGTAEDIWFAPSPPIRAAR